MEDFSPCEEDGVEVPSSLVSDVDSVIIVLVGLEVVIVNLTQLFPDTFSVNEEKFSLPEYVILVSASN